MLFRPRITHVYTIYLVIYRNLDRRQTHVCENKIDYTICVASLSVVTMVNGTAIMGNRQTTPFFGTSIHILQKLLDPWRN